MDKSNSTSSVPLGPSRPIHFASTASERDGLSLMVQYQLKLKLTQRQDRELTRWLRHLTSVWNWAVKKIENDARDGIHRSSFELAGLLVGHGKKIGMPSHVLNAMVHGGHGAWIRCYKGVARKPRLKGFRNRLNSIPFPDPIRLWPNGRVSVLGLGRVRFHKQELPEGKIKCGRIVKRASGWYLCLFIDAQPNAVPRVASGQIGIDPGFSSLLTLSTGEKIVHPRELEASALRLAQAQRGNGKKLTARIREHIANQRKDRNHKLTRRLISENIVIRFSKDNIKGVSRRFGKSVASSGHYQMRQMFSYKSPISGTEYDEPDSRKSTITCSTCGAETGPRGLAGLKVREWTCIECGTLHDRDVNAAQNAFIAGFGSNHERLARVA